MSPKLPLLLHRKYNWTLYLLHDSKITAKILNLNEMPVFREGSGEVQIKMQYYLPVSVSDSLVSNADSITSLSSVLNDDVVVNVIP